MHDDSFRQSRFRRVSDGPIFSRAWEKIGEKRTLFYSKTAITYLLKKGTAHTDRPFCLSIFDGRKSTPLFVMAVSALKNLQCAPAGAGN